MVCLLGAAWLGLGTALAQTTSGPSLAVPQVSTPPRIDGNLSEACWQTPPPITDFRCVDKQRTLPTQRTEAWVVCDGEALYVAARCYDDRMDQVPTRVTERDGPVWADDALEVFLMPGTPYYYHFVANLLGTQYDGRQGVGTPRDDTKPGAWNGEWQAVAQRQANSWTMEIAIPFSSLTWGPQRVTAPLRFNLGREQRRLAEFSCWPASAFNKVDEFAVLEGVKIDPQRYGLLVENLSPGEVIPGTNRYRAKIAAEPMAGAALTVRARLRALPQGLEQTFTTQLKSTAGAAVELEYQVPLEGGRVAAVFEYLDGQGKLRAGHSELWRVPAPVEARLDLPLLYRADGQVRLSGQVALRGAAKLEARLLSGSKPQRAFPITLAPEGSFQISLPLAGLAPGRYILETRLTVPGSTLAPVSNQFPFRVLAGPLD
jgi:hypothetical protein